MDGRLVSLNELLTGNRIFDIPVYQRGYAWEKKNLEDLWEDLEYLNTSKKHYFGTVLLKDSGETVKVGRITFKRFHVIDGQQRLTTLLILLHEIISKLREDGGDDVEDIEKGYIKNRGIYKLNPMGGDGKFFHHHIIDNNEFLDSHISTSSQQRLATAQAFFREQLTQEGEKRSPLECEEFLMHLMDKVDGLQLIEYQVNSDSDAIRIFETVNDRGRPLSDLEKTKSFLMHASYLGMNDDHEVEIRLEELNNSFALMHSYLESANGIKRLSLTESQVQRYHYLNYISTGKTSSHPVDSLKVRLRNILRIGQQGECAKYALDYAKDLEQAFLAVNGLAEIYKQGGPLSKIFLMGRTGNIFPILITSWLRYGKTPDNLEKILSLLEAFALRVYVVGGYRSHTGASKFNRIAHSMHQGGLDYDGLIAELKNINLEYQDDGQFESSLRREDFYNWRYSNDIKYLLSEYEIHIKESSDVPLELSTQEKILTSDYQVEHIWAQHPEDWDCMSQDMQDHHGQNVHRLGNLTIASKSWNASMGNKAFKKKRFNPDPHKPSYTNSGLWVQRELGKVVAPQLSEWNAETIREREDKIVEFALQRWSV
ncbi:MAG: DUF262 domain-containing HNH endonuclease family protein [Dehalococcoidia bacterium]|nr:DUF262 domain-containing HNH endonuclease family protein [Dehalococcoidia bacterium]